MKEVMRLNVLEEGCKVMNCATLAEKRLWWQGLRRGIREQGAGRGSRLCR